MVSDKGSLSLLPRLLVGAIAVALCVVSVLRADLPKAFTAEGQWDFKTYYYAVKVYEAGGNPWNQEELTRAAGDWVHPFIYPRPTLAFFRLFAFGDLATGKALFLTVKLACAAAMALLWLTCFVRPGGRGWFLAFLAVGFNAALARDLVSGNVSLLEQTLIWFGVWALLRGRPAWFCLLVLLAAQFKILPVCLLLLVLLTDSPRKWRWLAGGAAAAGLIAVGVYLSNPQAAAMFWHASTALGTTDPGGAVNPSSLALLRDLALAVVEQLSGPEVELARSAGLWAYGVCAVALVVGLVRRVRAGGDRFDLRAGLFCSLLTYALLMPRMKDYAYVLLLPAAFEVLHDRLARPTPERWLILGVAAALALPGTGIFWPYRSLLLAGWVWGMAMGGFGGRITSSASSCSCRSTVSPASAESA